MAEGSHVFSFPGSEMVVLSTSGMEPQVQSGEENKLKAFGRKHRTGLVTILFTNKGIVGGQISSFFN